MEQDVGVKRLFSEANIYTVICLLYSLRHILFGDFSLIGRGLFVLFFALSIYFFFKAVIGYMLPANLRALVVFVVLVLIYGGLMSLYGTDALWERKTANTFYLVTHFQSILPIFCFYYFAKEQQIDERWFRIVAIFYFVAVFLQFNSAESAMTEAQDNDEIVNNYAYYWLALIPLMVFFSEKPIIQYSGLALISFFLVSGFKRGAILLGGICLLVFIWHSIRSESLSRKVIIIVLVGVFVFFLFQYIENLMNTSELFVKRMNYTMEGNSSGREVIYSNYWSFFVNQKSFLSIVFGNGAYGTLKYLGLMAHNDWLEIMIDMGVVGTLVYFVYWFRNIRMCANSYYICSNEVFLGILLFVIIYLGATIFSMSIMNMPLYSTSVFGYLVAQYDDSLYSDLDDSSDSDLEDGLNSVSYE